MVIAPGHSDARYVQIEAFRALGRASVSPNGRNYYLTQALELERGSPIEADPIDESVLDVLRGVPIENFMRAMPVNLDAQKAAETDTLAVFDFTGTTSAADSTWTLHVRRGVAALSRGEAAAPALRIRTDSGVWKQLVTGLRNPASAYASGEIEVQGGLIALVRFLSLFR